MVWRSISDSLLYNMQGFKGATTTTTTTIPGMNGRRARPPTHSSTGDTPRSGAHTGTGRGGRRTPPSHILWRPHGAGPCGHGRVYPSGVLGQLGRVIEEWRHPLASHRPPPNPHKGMVWRSISNSLLYNMQGFKGAASFIIINPWYEREAGAPAHLVRATTLGKPPIPIFFTSLLRSRSRGRRTDGSFTAAA